MQDPRMPFSEGTPSVKPQKKKKALTIQNPTLSTKAKKNDAKAIYENSQASLPSKSAQKASKRGSRNDQSQPERSNSDSLPDSSASGNEYRVLRRKYLLLEEESFSLGTNLKGVDDEVKTLEDEKIALLDKLVVLEGLIDPLNCSPFLRESYSIFNFKRV